MSDSQILIFAGEDEMAASDLARKFRAEGRYAMAISAFLYELMPCLHTIIMPDVPDWRADLIRADYPNKEMMYFGITSPVLAIDNPMPKKRGRPRKVMQ